jgi:hypothetical protein
MTYWYYSYTYPTYFSTEEYADGVYKTSESMFPVAEVKEMIHALRKKEETYFGPLVFRCIQEITETQYKDHIENELI